MSLTDRVREIEGLNSATNDGEVASLTVEELRRDVKKWTSLEAIAAIMVDNPYQAKNELRSSCRHALAEPKWVSLSGAEKRALIEELIDVVFGMGPIESLIEDESITEIMINGSREIFFERDGKLIKSNLAFDSDEQVRVLIDRIIGPLGRRIDESSPLVNARLANGHRVHAVIPPISPDGPHMTIRAFKRKVIRLEEMRDGGSFDELVLKFLQWLVIMRKNVCVSGGTGSGKTTMLNALSCLISAGERVITIEDSLELKFDEVNHVVRLEARPNNTEGKGAVTIRDLVINSLRMRPDRIIVGECRGGEALDMLQAMMTGHDGSLTTLHSNSPEDVVERMITMVRYAVDLPVDAIEAQIGNSFDYIIQVARGESGNRFLTCIAEVGFNRDTRRCVVNRIYERELYSDTGKWIAIPIMISEMLDKPSCVPFDIEEVEIWKSKVLA